MSSSAIALLAALLVPPQEFPDLERARAQARDGRAEAAEELCRKIEKDPKAPAPAKAAVTLVRAEIAYQQAIRETDFAKTLSGLDVAIERAGKALGNPASAAEARGTTGWLLGQKARMMAGALDAGQSPELQERLTRDTPAAFDRAEKHLRDTIAELEKSGPEEDLVDARLELPKLIAVRARLPGLGEPARRHLLQEAIRQFADFAFLNCNRGIGFEALLEEGKCFLDLPDTAQAEKWFRAALGLKRALVDWKMKENAYHQAILEEATTRLAETFIQAGKPQDAIALIDAALKTNASAAKSGFGLALRRVKAAALHRLRDFAAAFALAGQVAEEDSEGRHGFAARRMMERWVVETETAPPAQILAAAEAAFARAQITRALSLLRRCIESCRGEKDRKEIVPVAQFRTGECLQKLNRPREAALAYQWVYDRFPKHELAPKACFEAARCFNLEFGLTGDKRDEDQVQRCLEQFGTLGATGALDGTVKFLRADAAEKAGQLAKAAELYLQVTPEADVYERALLLAGNVLRREAQRLWKAGQKEPAVRELRRAEEALGKLIGRTAVELMARMELALVLQHPAIGRMKESLGHLEVCERSLAGDARLVRIRSLQVPAYLEMNDLEKAAATVDAMIQRFPDAPETAIACRSVGARLDRVTSEMIEKKQEGPVEANLEKIRRYYTTWLRLAPALQLPTVQELVSVADVLYLIAKRLNGLDEDVLSFADIPGKPVPHPSCFEDASLALALALQGGGAKLPAADRLRLLTRSARCASFPAKDAAGWEKAQQRYEEIFKSFPLLDAKGQIDPVLLAAQKPLLATYLELGHVFVEQGRKGKKFQFDNAYRVFGNIAGVTASRSQPWWHARYMAASVLFERGAARDLENVQVLIDNLERNNPDFDGDQFGMKSRFLELRNQISIRR